MFGGDGDDFLFVQSAGSTASGGPGDDRVEASAGVIFDIRGDAFDTDEWWLTIRHTPDGLTLDHAIAANPGAVFEVESFAYDDFVSLFAANGAMMRVTEPGEGGPVQVGRVLLSVRSDEPPLLDWADGRETFEAALEAAFNDSIL